MATISGYMVKDIKISELPLLPGSYMTVIIEVQGCTFAGSVEVYYTGDGDPFVDAQARAIKAALEESRKSDFKLFGRSAGGNWGGKGGGPGRPQDPNATASEKQMGRLFAIAKSNGFDSASVRKAIKTEGWSEPLTVGQIDSLIKRIESKAKDKKPA